MSFNYDGGPKVKFKTSVLDKANKITDADMNDVADKLSANEALGVNAQSTADTGVSNAATAQSTANTALADAATADGKGQQGIDDAATAQNAINNHEADLANPHGVTKAQIGLTNADDTSDADKPVSIAQNAINITKADKAEVDRRNQTYATGSDAYAIADRISQKPLGKTVDLFAFNEKLSASRKKYLSFAIYFHSTFLNGVASTINQDPYDLYSTRLSAANFINRFGLLETAAIDEPVIEWSYDSSEVRKPAFRAEPTSENIIEYSGDFSNFYWNNNSNTNRVLSTNPSPDGTLNAYVVTRNTGNQLGWNDPFGGTISEPYASSIWARKISGSGKIILTDSNSIQTIFDITHEWERFEVSTVALTTFIRAYFTIFDDADVIEVYESQMEEKHKATSNIFTNGSKVTRFEDKALVNTNLVGQINSEEGTILLKLDLLKYANFSATEVVSFYEDSSNYISFQFSDISVYCSYTVNGTAGGSGIQFPMNEFAGGYLVYRYSLIESSLWYNGVKKVFNNGVNDNSATISSIKLAVPNGNQKTRALFEEIEIYTKALSDAEIINRTTL